MEYIFHMLFFIQVLLGQQLRFQPLSDDPKTWDIFLIRVLVISGSSETNDRDIDDSFCERITRGLSADPS